MSDEGIKRITGLDDAEELAQKKGYLTLDQALGFQIRHFLPPSPPTDGTPRDPLKLTAVDWDFKALMEEPLEVRKVALVHELARECAAMREACRIYEAGLQEAKDWEDKETAAKCALCDAEDEVEKLEKELVRLEAGKGSVKKFDAAKQRLDAAREKARLAERNASFIIVSAHHGEERQAWIHAEEFIQTFLKRLPFGARGLQTDAIADDRPWCEIEEGTRRDLVLKIVEIEKKRGDAKDSKRGLRYKDMEADGPGWPFDDPIQFARDWNERTGLPEFNHNDGMPGRMILAERHENSHRLPILSETLNLCVCLNFSDDEILGAFADWLKWRRANLDDDLKAFRDEGGSRERLNESQVNPNFKALAALRLWARFGNKEAAYQFRKLYSASEKRTGKKNAKEAPFTLVAGLVAKAVKIGAEFLPECALDSAVKRIEL